jgi:hypothetical protein
VVRWLSAHPGVAPSMRTVMVTAWAVENDSLLKDLGVGTVLRKPVRLKDLDLLIEQAVRDRLAEDCPTSR